MSGWTAAAWSLRSVLVLAPLGALALAVPAADGDTPATWTTLVVTVAGLAWAARPEGAGGVVAPLAVLGWWAWAVPGLSAWALPAAGLLVSAHAAALVASHGPRDLVPGPGVLGLWGRRTLLLAAGGVPVWLVGLVLVSTDQGLPDWAWPLAAATVAAAGLWATARVVEEESAA